MLYASLILSNFVTDFNVTDKIWPWNMCSIGNVSFVLWHTPYLKCWCPDFSPLCILMFVHKCFSLPSCFYYEKQCLSLWIWCKFYFHWFINSLTLHSPVPLFQCTYTTNDTVINCVPKEYFYKEFKQCRCTSFLLLLGFSLLLFVHLWTLVLFSPVWCYIRCPLLNHCAVAL